MTDLQPGPDTLTSREAVLRELARTADSPLVAAFPHGVMVVFDHDLRYLSAGGPVLTDVGLSRPQVKGRTIFEVLPRETAELIEPLYRRALRGEHTVDDVPFLGRTYEQRLAPVIHDGEVVAGVGFNQDVTEARAAERALRESEERLRLIFDHAPIGVAVVDLDGRWREVNAAVTTLTGYSREQLLAMTFQDITHPDDLEADLDHLRRLAAGEITSFQVEKRYLTATRSVVWVLLSVVLVRGEDGTPLYYLGQIQDITERRRQHDALRDFTGMLAHDLRTPTTVVSGFLDHVLSSWDDQSAEQRRRMLERAAAGAHSMRSLLDNALTATALESEGLVARPRRVDLRGAVTAVLDGLHCNGTVVDVTGVEASKVWADPGHVSQIVTNLLTNAVKYGGSAVRVTAREDGDQVVLEVADDGPGVPAEFVPELFERFTRAEEARRGDQKGSGLGLYIVRDLLALNGGTIDYRDTDGGGATFTVRLPRGGR